MYDYKKNDLIVKKGLNPNQIVGEPMTAIRAKHFTSVSEADFNANSMGRIVCVADNPGDHWFVSQDYLDKNYKFYDPEADGKGWVVIYDSQDWKVFDSKKEALDFIKIWPMLDSEELFMLVVNDIRETSDFMLDMEMDDEYIETVLAEHERCAREGHLK